MLVDALEHALMWKKGPCDGAPSPLVTKDRPENGLGTFLWVSMVLK